MKLLTLLSTFFAASLITTLQGCDLLPKQADSQPQESSSTQVSQPTEANPFRDAVNKATEAAKLTQTSKTSKEWTTVVDTWQQAIK